MNFTKTQRVTFGRKASQAGWYFAGTKLTGNDRIQYLLAVSQNNSHHHADSRISAGRRAFCALQHEGMGRHGTNPEKIHYPLMTAPRSVLDCPTRTSRRMQ